jgi:catalase
MSKEMTMKNSGKLEQEKSTAQNGDAKLAAGGELHQITGGGHPALTSNQGIALSDNQNSLKANP